MGCIVNVLPPARVIQMTSASNDFCRLTSQSVAEKQLIEEESVGADR